jgi:hypothetical protein
LVLLLGTVLELIQENVTVCLAHGIADDITVIQDLHSQWNQILESDLGEVNSSCSDRVARQQDVLPCQDWTKADVVFDDDSAGEAADIVAIRILGGMHAPTAIEVVLYHCKYSNRSLPGHRIDDLYVVCGQAQKSVAWVTSDSKKSDIFTHLLRREKDRVNNGRPTRFELGDIDLLQTVREMSWSGDTSAHDTPGWTMATERDTGSM